MKEISYGLEDSRDEYTSDQPSLELQIDAATWTQPVRPFIDSITPTLRPGFIVPFPRVDLDKQEIIYPRHMLETDTDEPTLPGMPVEYLIPQEYSRLPGGFIHTEMPRPLAGIALLDMNLDGKPAASSGLQTNTI